MLFDTHAHMDDRAFDEDRQTLLASLPGQGIGLLMNPGCSLESSRRADALSRAYDYIYAAVGSHPDAADEVDPAVLAEYQQLCRENPKIRAIGEIGLDYHYEDIPRDRQQAAFRAQMGLARELGLPVMFHTGLSVFKGSRLKYGDPVFYDDIAVDFPELKIVMCHGGRDCWYKEAFTVARLHENVYIDVAGLPPKKLLTYFPDLPRQAHKFVFGTDWPSVDIGKNADAVAQLPLPEADIRAILGETAGRLLGLAQEGRGAAAAGEQLL